MRKHLSILFLVVLLFVGLVGCTGSSTTQQLETPELQLSAEGPLYAGANSSTATWEFDLTEILGNAEKEVSKNQMKIDLLDNSKQSKLVLEENNKTESTKNTN